MQNYLTSFQKSRGYKHISLVFITIVLIKKYLIYAYLAKHLNDVIVSI